MMVSLYVGAMSYFVYLKRAQKRTVDFGFFEQ
jgi:hypothetical protein